jgi:CHAD domain-containing protein
MARSGVSESNGTISVVADALDQEPMPCLGPGAPVVDTIRLALRGGEQRLRQHEPAARQGDVEGVHRMRTATRRLRSELDLYRDLLEGDVAKTLNRELKWLGRVLGAVRDRDVMRDRLRLSAGALAMDLGPLFSGLADRHAAASGELQAALDSPRFQHLMEQLSEAAQQPAVTGEAWEPAGRALPPLARKTWKRLRSAARKLDLADADVDYHEVRKRAKRSRHTAESVCLALDPDDADDARRFARRARAVQDVLGEHQDAIVACDQIRQIATEHSSDGPFNLAAGRLLERQAIDAETSRTRFFKAWQKLDRAKNVRWTKR